ncbi:hypothetical protein MHJ63_07360 [Pseudoglutamicibacter albus]|uniref:hypothetical protein n=1 Tax=Pseudoglutamicibacter albus TaxID=98671 RepID=UPI001EF5B4FB|nr:hypothetical protein [Pseudoglutamicibacter albus]MCG7305078.1 hypothetical protein [Pseudoglutamicibacter albus]
MTMKNVPPEVLAARKAQYLRNIAELDYRRNLLRLQQLGLPQTEIASLLRVSQPNVQKILQRSASISMPCEGFSGADPYEICERYAAGLIDRAQLVDELTRWEYVPQAQTNDLFDDLLMDAPGSVDDLDRALSCGLIDDELYDEIADRNEARKTAE